MSSTLRFNCTPAWYRSSHVSTPWPGISLVGHLRHTAICISTQAPPTCCIKLFGGVGVAIQRKWSSIIDSIRICLAYFELWAHRSLYHELASTFRNIQWENLDTCATDWRRRTMSLPVQTRWWLSSKTIIIASTEWWPVCWFRPEADLLTCCSY